MYLCLRSSMDFSLPLVVCLVRERGNPALDDRRTCNRYIALDGGEGRKHRGCRGELDPCVRLHEPAFVCQTSTRRVQETFGWQTVSVCGGLPVQGNARTVLKQFSCCTWSTLAARHQTSQRDACVEASQKGLGTCRESLAPRPKQ